MSNLRMLMDGFSRSLLSPPRDVVAALGELPTVGQLPSPWATWTLIEIVLHRRRQLWARGLIRDRLNDQIPPLEKLLPVDLGFVGKVPGSPQWEYLVDNDYRCCTLMDRVTGEEINVVLGTVEDETSYFLAQDLIRSWERFQPRAGGARLLRLHPTLASVNVAIEELTELGFLEEVDLDEGLLAHRLTTAVVTHAADIEGFVEAWEQERCRVWLSALIGDWMAVATDSIASWDSKLMAFTKARADSCRSQRITRLHHLLSTDYEPCDHAALWDLGGDLPREMAFWR